MKAVVRWLAGVAAATALALGGLVFAVVVLPSTTAHATLTCNTSWKVNVSGDWNTAANWTSGVPTSSTNACITLGGTYTVSISGLAAQAKTITLGDPSGTTAQTLAITGQGCIAAASLTTSATGSTVKKTGILQLTSNTCSGNTASLVVPIVDTLTNTGVIDIEPGAGGARQIQGQIINNGTMTVNVNADLLPGTNFTNQGPTNIADGVTLLADTPTGPPGTTFTNGTGGQVNSSGGSMTGVLYMNPGNAFVEGAGTTNTANTYIDTGTLSYTGAGASQLTTRGAGGLSGAPSAGQSFTIQGEGCVVAATETATTTATNAGTITLTSAVCSGNTSTLTAAPGVTLTNSGLIDAEVGAGGARQLSGAFVNTGTALFNTNADLLTGSSFVNNGVVNIADAVQWTIDSSGSTFTNGASGSINSSGVAQSGVLYENPSNSFVEAGTTNVANTYVDTSSLSYTGTGASQIITRGTGSLTGAPAVGQSLTIQGLGCSAAALETLTASATNAGTITLSSTQCSGNTTTLTVPSGATLTNSGALTTAFGAGGGRAINGDITNTSAGTFTTLAVTTYKPTTLFLNQGSVVATASLTFANSKNTVVDNAAGSMKGAVNVSKGTFEQGNGTIIGAVGVSNGTTKFIGTGKGSVIEKGTGILQGTLVSGQKYTLQAKGCAAAATVSTSGPVVNGGTIILTSTACSGNTASLTIPVGSSLANSGSLQTTVGAGGGRNISGAVTNTGTVSVGISTAFSGTWDNKGSVTIADSTSLSIPASSSTTWTNDTGGSVVTTGSATTGNLYMNTGNTFVEGAGTTSGGPAYVDGSQLTYTGGGASQIVVRDTGTLTGAPSAAQGLTLQGLGCAGAATETLTGSATNAGTITLTDAVCSGNSDTLNVPSGSTLTNTGTLDSEPGVTGGQLRSITGNVTSSGPFIVNANTSYSGGAWDNMGAVTIADSVSLAVTASTSTTWTNDTGGSIATTNDASTGNFYMNTGNTFVEGAGTTTGGPVYVDGSALSYTGSGASWILVRDTGTLTATSIATNQVLWIQGLGCAGAATETASSSFANHGTIVLTSAQCSGNTATLTLPGGATLTNDHILQAVNGAGVGGGRVLNGNLTNNGTVGPSDGPTLSVNGAFTNSTTGTVAVTVPTSTPTLTISGTATISGGTLKAVPQSGATFTPGQTFPALSAGTVTGTFTTVTGGPGQTWTALYTPTSVSLEYLAP